MSKNFVQNALLRQSMLSTYRAFARAQFWRQGPRIFLNSIPKAGTHLLTAELENFPALQNSRLHIESRQVDAALNGSRIENFEVDIPRMEKLIGSVRRGQFFSAHLFWSRELEALLVSRSIRSIFMLRDPRDVLVSQLHYILGLRRHFLHRFFANDLGSDDERLRLLVLGQPSNPFVRSMRGSLERFLPWAETSAVLPIKFEDLVGERGGGAASDKLLALQQIAAHCGLDESALAVLATRPAKTTPTLRKGKAYGWRDALPDNIKKLVEHECGDLIERMGYARQ